MQHKTCSGRCSGCAFTPGAKAFDEVNNRLVGILSAIGGIPFICHEQLGWTPGQEGYPQGKSRVELAYDNLMAAPKMIHDSPDMARAISDATPTGIPAVVFATDRRIIGKDPTCGGWRAAVADLARQGWFRTDRVAKRRLVRSIIDAVEARPVDVKTGRAKIIELAEWLRRDGVKTGLFES